MNKHLSMAIAYTSLGWRVFPVKAGSKKPPIVGWQAKAARTPEEAERLFASAGDCNLGVATGEPSGLWALDIDPRHGGDESLEVLEHQYGKLPDTVCQRTPSGGQHLLFKMPADGRDIRNRAGVLPGIDVRGTDGYIVVPPSLVDGKSYSWKESSRPGEAPIAEAPDWLIRLVTGPKPGGDAVRDGQGTQPIIPEGQRNDALTRFAGKLRRTGMTVGDMTLALKGMNSKRCRPPLGDHEVEKIAQNIGRFPSGGSPPPGPWSDPLPLPDFPQPVFPVEVLPPWIREYVAALAESTQTPVDAAGMLSLAVLAAACAKKIKVQISADWSQPLNLYVVVALPPASRKSAVMTAMKRPLQDFERDQIENARPEVARQAEQLEIKRKRQESLRRKIAEADSGHDKSAWESEAAEIVTELATAQVPRVPRLIADNVTSEQLVTLLAENHGYMVVLSPEGGELFSIMAGRYSNGAPNFGVFLSAHDGDDLRVDRRTRASEWIEEPALTLALMVQPDVIRGLAAHPQFKHRGLVGRFLYSIPRNTLGSRRSATRPIPQQVRDRYELCVRQLLQATYGEGKTLNVSPEAREVLRAFQDSLEPRLNPDTGDLAYLADWAGKLAGHAARIAGLFALADGGDPISAEIMRRAVHLAVDYLLPHAMAAHAVMGADETLEEARLILGAIERSRATLFSRRDAHRWLKGQERFRRATALDRGLQVLIDHGCIRTLTTGEPHKGPGRPASQVYEVNPAIHSGGGTGRTESPQSPQLPPRTNSGDSVDCVPENGAEDGGGLS